jgi:hypothetical protein
VSAILCPPETTLLPYHPQSFEVLDGIYRGLPLKMAEGLERQRLQERRPRCGVSSRKVTLRPWWRVFRATPALRLTVGGPA